METEISSIDKLALYVGKVVLILSAIYIVSWVILQLTAEEDFEEELESI